MDSNQLSGYEVLMAIRRINRAVDLQSKSLKKRYGVTGPQLLLINEIYNDGSLSSGRLAEKVSLSHATVSRILDRLELQGYIIRTRSLSDKRKILITVSEKSKSILEKNPAILQDEFLKRYQVLKEWEKTQILASLQHVAALMRVEKIEKDLNGSFDYFE